MPTEHDQWTSGSAYEAYVGRWSRQVACEFIEWLGVPPGQRWLDVGFGTGALMRTIFDSAAPSAVVGIDQSPAFVAFTEESEVSTASGFAAADAMALPFRDGSFGAAVSGLVLNFVPEPPVMVSEMARVTQAGGAVAVYVWDYAGEMQMLRQFWDAVIELDPTARHYDEGMRFSMCHQDRLREMFEAAGLSDVETGAIDIPTNFRDFDDYWSPFLGATGTAPGYVASLDETDRTVLSDRLRERLPIRPDGSIHLIARANAVRGSRI
jgi:ubiquinone/menaquinone biosynthesis C-methylase UbiE